MTLQIPFTRTEKSYSYTYRHWRQLHNNKWVKSKIVYCYYLLHMVSRKLKHISTTCLYAQGKTYMGTQYNCTYIIVCMTRTVPIFGLVRLAILGGCENCSKAFYMVLSSHTDGQAAFQICSKPNVSSFQMKIWNEGPAPLPDSKPF